MTRKVEGSSSQVHGHEEVKNPPVNFVCKIFQDAFAGIGLALSFAYNFVGSLCGRVSSCLNGSIFCNGKKDKTSQEKTGEKTDRAASKVLGKEKLIEEEESDLKKILASSEDEQGGVEEKHFHVQGIFDSEEERDSEILGRVGLGEEEKLEPKDGLDLKENELESDKEEELDIQETLDSKERALLEVLSEDETQVAEISADQEEPKLEGESESSQLHVSEEPKDIISAGNVDELVGESMVEPLPEEKSSPLFKELAELAAELPLSVGESSSPQKNTMEKMYRNAQEAISMHIEQCKAEEKKVFLNALPPLEILMNPTSDRPLQFEYSAFGAQGGIRETMEDAHFYNELSSGLFAGVLDGHGGSDVANFAAEMFPKLFEEVFSLHGKDVYTTFETLIQLIEEKIEKKHPEWNSQGSTAVLSFVDPATRLIYTATLGDSESTIYRRVDGQFKAIPLSCLRNWASPKDAHRAAAAWAEEGLASKFLATQSSKALRYPPRFGLNVSRAIGDVDCKGCKNNPKAPNAISEKPKISVHQLETGDVVILACDGLHDYVRQDQIIEVLSAGSFETAASRLVEKAINECFSRDNVTVLALRVK